MINIQKKYFRNTDLDPDQDLWTICRFWSGYKLFAKVISRRQKSLLAREELGRSVGWNDSLIRNFFLDWFSPNTYSKLLSWKMSSAFNVCCIYSNTLLNTVIMGASIMNSDQTAQKGAVWSGFILFAVRAAEVYISRRESRRHCHEWRVIMEMNKR